MRKYQKFIPIILLGLILCLVIWKVTPPLSLNEVTFTHLVLFFLPLFLLISFLTNLFHKNLTKSFLHSISALLLLILKAYVILSIITFIIAILVLTAAFFYKRPSKKSSKTPPKPVAKSPGLKQIRFN